ncbi:uncharacterized protein LOC142234165 [Haematobia irritans]|uniref:uncharacterized protein LOC142234165 n=1 Tax=Haematobia irritans TaxID=7368 RepID=UPI003F50254E
MSGKTNDFVQGMCKRQPHCEKQCAVFNDMQISNNSALLPDVNLELQMLEEEQQLNQQYLRRKYAILQQRGDLTNRPKNEVFGSSLRQFIDSSIFQPTPRQIAARQVLPKELPSFCGDPEKWPIFISSFENSTSVGGYSKAENLIRLQQCLKGKAREMVRSKLLLPQMVDEIIETLKMYFGRLELILERVIERARQTPPPREKLEAIIDYSMSVRNICSSIEACHMGAHLNNPMLLKELLDKLSNNYKLQWAMLPKPDGVLLLKAFSDWLYSIAVAASQVTTPTITKKGGLLNTHMEATGTGVACFACGATDHKLAQCTEFPDWPPERKWDLIREKRICKNCLNIHRRICNLNRYCGVNGCEARHHPQLHGYNTATDTQFFTNTAEVHSHHKAVPAYRRNGETLFRIIPVRIYGTDRHIDTYAFLDEGSSITLMEEGIVSKLGLKGIKESLCLKWTGDTKRIEESSFIRSMDIMNPQNGSTFKLTGIHTVKNLALPIQSIDERVLKAKYPYLSNVPLSSYSDAKPTILIGTDNWNLAVPLRICEGPWNCPIATKTRLGWAIQGTSADGHTNQLVNIHMCECVQELEKIHEAVNNMYRLESSAEKDIISADDEKAIRILESTCNFKGDRYEIGLPWINPNIEFPDSYKTALKRSICLKRKMQNDMELKLKVVYQVNNLIQKGYARTVRQEELRSTRSRVWYLPIFVTFNPNKPHRVRLVWDTAAKTEGISLNDLLLVGPDLLTSLVEILLKFRIGRIGICGDIAEMFHQILVREEDRHSQRFLWWHDGDDEPTIYVMDSLTFGLNSAPCIAHFIRNKNADRYIDRYPKAVDAIKHNHYVDDLLYSIDDEDEAKRLTDEIRQYMPLQAS